MKKIALLFVAMVVVLSTSCGNSAKREQEIRDSLRADSIMKDSILRAKLDSIREDSMWRYRITPDLALFELHGPVKSVNAQKKATIDDYGNISLKVSFSESGTVQQVLESNKSFAISRDTHERIKSMTRVVSNGGVNYGKIVYTYKYNDKGYLQNENRSVYTDEGGFLNTSYEYDSNGNVVSDKCRDEYAEGETNSTSTYKIIEQDEFGNWTKRTKTIKYKDYNELREINGYGPAVTSGTKTFTETRKIIYYERENK